MASITDIPPDLLDPQAKDRFIKWLIRQDIKYGPRRRLASLWRQTTGAGFTTHEWRLIQARD